MRLFNFMIDEATDSRLKAESIRTGVEMSEMARRAIKVYLHMLEVTREEPDRRRAKRPCNVQSGE